MTLLLLAGCRFIGEQEWRADEARLFGGADCAAGELGLTGDADDGDVTLQGGAPYGAIGVSVGPVGDVDDDGAPDAGFGTANGFVVVTGTIDDQDGVAHDDGTLSPPHEALGIEGLSGLYPTGRYAGDVDGDGSGDLVLATTLPAEDAGVWWVPGPLESGTSVRLADLDAVRILDEGESFLAEGIGDVDGSGHGDLVVAGVGAFVVRGEDLGVWATFSGIEAPRVAAAGDVDGDGVGDVVVADPTHVGANGHADEGAAWVVTAIEAGDLVLDLADAALVGDEDGGARSTAGVGTHVRGVGDLDGGGLDDVAVTAPAGNGRSVLLLLDGEEVTLRGPEDGEPGAWGFASGVAPAGDLDGDCVADLVVTALASEDDVGGVFVLLGGPERRAHGFVGAEEMLALPTSGGEPFRYELVAGGAGDRDGDGLDDLLVGAATWGTEGEGAVWLHLGGP